MYSPRKQSFSSKKKKADSNNHIFNFEDKSMSSCYKNLSQINSDNYLQL